MKRGAASGGAGVDRWFPGTATAALAAIVALGLVARLATLDLQSFWFDEQVTVDIVQLPVLDLLRQVLATESNPPLYYLAAGAWERVFGAGEVGLRSLSAVAGVATVPVMFAAGVQLGGRRTGLIAAALTAVSPMLVWYSQEARNYSLFCLLSAIAFLCFLRSAASPGTRWIWVWVVVSGLSLCVHYFAVFAILPQLAWLMTKRRDVFAELCGAAAILATVALALVPTVVAQLGRATWIGTEDLGVRLAQIPAHFLVGMQSPWVALPIVAVATAVAVVAFGARQASARPALVIAGTTLGGGLLLLVLAAAVGEDYIVSRNAIGLWVPFTLGLAAAIAALRAPWTALASGALCTCGIGLIVWGALTWETHRPDFRGLAEELGATHTERLIVSQTAYSSPLTLYMPETEAVATDPGASSRLIVVELQPIDDHSVGPCWWTAACGGSDRAPSPAYVPPAAFRRTGGGSTRFFVYTGFRARPGTAAKAPPPGFPPRTFIQSPTGLPWR